jgi:hypothetical protein
MKTGVVLLGFACISLLVVVSGVIGYSYYDNDKQLQTAKAVIKSQDEDIAKLNADYTRVVADNVIYMKESRLKSFTTLKELERFVKADTTDQEFKDDYASSACIHMMVNAREQGYWLGMGVLNQTPENLYAAILKDRQGVRISWTTYCLAVVGDADLYLIDPQNDTYIFLVMAMSADWADYSGRTVDFK